MSMKPNHTMAAIASGSAVIYGWWAHGWQGLLLAICLSAAWFGLQLRQQRRLMKQASTRPAGQIDSVVTMQAQLAHGMDMAEVVALAGCLGHKTGVLDDWQWSDAAGNDIVVSFRRGVVIRWAVAHSDVSDPGEPLRPLAEQRFQHQEPRAQFNALAPAAKTA